MVISAQLQEAVSRAKPGEAARKNIRGAKVGTERQWKRGTVVKTRQGWVDKETGEPAGPGAKKAAAPAKKSASKEEPKGLAGKLKKAVGKVSKALKGLPEDARRLATDKEFRAQAGKQMAGALRRKSNAAVKHVMGELKELGEAGAALKKVSLGQPLSKEDKHALKGAAKTIGTTVAGTIAMGGIAHLTAGALATHFAAETLLKAAGRAALFANLVVAGEPLVEAEDGEATVRKVIEAVTRKLESLGGLSDAEIEGILTKAKGGNDEVS